MEIDNTISSPIDTTGIPTLDQVEWIDVSRKLIYKHSLIGVLWGVILLGLGLIPLIFTLSNATELWKTLVLIGYVLLCLLFVWIVIWPVLEVPKRGYVVRDLDLVYKFGLLSTTQSSVPFTRIQHVITKEGIFDRFYGLMSVSIITAGGLVSVNGFERDLAERIREYILERVNELSEPDLETLYDLGPIETEEELPVQNHPSGSY